MEVTLQTAKSQIIVDKTSTYNIHVIRRLNMLETTTIITLRDINGKLCTVLSGTCTKTDAFMILNINEPNAKIAEYPLY